MPEVLFGCDHGYFDVYSTGQGSYLYGFACGEVTAEVFTIYFVDIGECLHIGDEDGRFQDIAEVHTGFCQYAFKVLHNLVCFGDDISSNELVSFRMECDLAGYEQHIACFNGLVVGPNGGRGFRGVDDLFFHRL